jgi:hypothetical protein
MSSRGQGHQGVRLMKGNVQRNVMSKYEVNMFTNEEVMANGKVFIRKFYVQGQCHPGVKVIKVCAW